MRALRGSLADLRHHFTRYLAILAAIALSVGFAVATQVLVPTAMSGMVHKMVPYTTDAVASTGFSRHGEDAVSPDYLASLTKAVAAIPGIDSYSVRQSGVSVQAGGTTSRVNLNSVPPREDLRWFRIVEGTLPNAATDIVLPQSLAKKLKLTVGEKVNVDNYTGPSKPMTLVGLSNLADGFSSPGLVAESAIENGPEAGTTLLINGPGTPQETVDLVRSKVAPELAQYVKTSDQTRTDTLLSLTQGQDSGKYMALGFGAISMLVCVIIVATTFSILMTGRRRQIGLLRAVGAYQSQVAWRYVIESLVVGLLGSVLGLGLGLAAAAGIAAIADWLAGGLVIPWAPVLGLCVAGALIVLLSSLGPIIKSMRTSPLEALRPVAPADVVRRNSWIRAILCTLLVLGGSAILWNAAQLSSKNNDQAAVMNILLLALVGGVAVSVGVLSSGSLYVPRLVRIFGKGLTPLGATGRLSTENAVRNPKRAAATATALMLAVGLITTLIVAVGTARETAMAHVNNTRPVDLIVASEKGVYPDGIDKIAGIQSSAQLRGAKGTMKAGTNEYPEYIAVAPDMARVLRQPVAQPTDDQILMWLGNRNEKNPVTSVKVSVGDKSVTLTPVWTSLNANIVSEATLSKLTSTRTPFETWYRLSDDAPVAQVISDVQKKLTPMGLRLSGTAMEKASLLETFNGFLTIMLALLGISGVIALMGVGNTLGLSVLERTRENAILRALGLQSLGLRIMLFLEAILLTLAGVGVAVVAGIAFGWVGSKIMLDMFRWPIVWNIPWWQIAGVVAIAMVAGMLSSILPGRRAAKAAPVEALADEG